ncbi:hypothetical protein [Streptomyces sp. NPDC004680]|uniref:hypothetical protein n=3 Tax=Streptomyces TaxID=1883 RepID=UPI0033A1ADBF
MYLVFLYFLAESEFLFGMATFGPGRLIEHPMCPQIQRVDAIVAARLNAAYAYPPPAACPDPAPAVRPSQTALADHRPVREALAYRALAECAGCGLPGCAPGESLCPACLNWPLCRCCTGPTPRRAHPGSDGRCITCATASTRRLEGTSA